MTITDDRPVTGTASGLRAAAMRCLAGDCTAEELRAWAGNAALVDRIAVRSGRPAEDLRNEMLAVAVVVDMITREGLTPEQCRFLLGADKADSPRLALVPSAA
jgi:hypothetical protein